jgi:hypothetical protein
MQQSTKAALFSALLFPGSGQLLLKRYLSGLLFAATALACLGILVVRAIDIAQAIVDRILSGDLPLDAAYLSAEISAQSAAADSTLANAATWVLVGCWIASSIDAFRLGRRHDRATRDGNADKISGASNTG